jgi:hypothetical protein
VLGVVGYVTFDLLPPWLRHLQDADARWLERQAAIAFLDGLLIAYGLALVVAMVGTLVLAFPWRRSPGLRSRSRARLLLLSLAAIISVLAPEAGAAAWQAWLHRSPRLPALGSHAKAIGEEVGTGLNPATVSVPSLPDRLPPRQAQHGTGASPLKLLVIGESSGRGEPYNPWLSLGQIVAWRLEQVFPGRPIDVDIWAIGGATLAIMHNKLAGLTYRPDALIVYAGHNEFPARYSWMRDVDYYLDVDLPPRVPLVPSVASLSRFSPLCRLIQETRELQWTDMMPPRVVTRELIDRPVCAAAEAAAILTDFRLRLEAIAGYCEAIATFPIFVIPPSNDGDFDPSRSILAPEIPNDQRVAFARSVARARTLETKDGALAVRIDRELV